MAEPGDVRAPTVCRGAGPVAGILAAGGRVVAVLAPGETLGPRPAGPGRVAVLVGDWEDREVRDAAATMGAELFGA